MAESVLAESSPNLLRESDGCPMVELNSTDATRNSLLGPPNGTLNLRIRGTDLDGRIIRVRAQKCSIGAAADCGIRIRSSAARPIHCVVFRGRQGMLVRRWAPDTLLNGKSFQEAWLQPGDRLTVGPVEFDVLGENCDDEPLCSDTPRDSTLAPDIQDKPPVERVKQRQPTDQEQAADQNEPTENSTENLAETSAETSAGEANTRRANDATPQRNRFGRRDYGASPEFRSAADDEQSDEGQRRGMLMQIEIMQQRLDEIERCHTGERGRTSPQALTNPSDLTSQAEAGGQLNTTTSVDQRLEADLLEQNRQLDELTECSDIEDDFEAQIDEVQQQADELASLQQRLDSADSKLAAVRHAFQSASDTFQKQLAEADERQRDLNQSANDQATCLQEQLNQNESVLGEVRAASEKQSAFLREQITTLECQLAEASSHGDSLTAQIEDVRAKFGGREHDFVEQQAALQAGHGKLEGELAELQIQLTGAEGDLETSQAETAEFRDQVKQLRSELAQFEEQSLQQSKATSFEHDELLTELTIAEQDREANAERANGLQSQVEQLERELSTKADQLAQQEELRSELTVAEREREANAERANDLQSHVERLERELSTNEAQLAQHVNDSQSEADELRLRVDSLEEESQANDGSRTLREDELAELREKLQQAKAELATQTDSVSGQDSATASVDAADKDAEDLREKLSAFQEQWEKDRSA